MTIASHNVAAVPRSPLAVAEHIFQLIGCAPAGLALDTDVVPRLPLTELRDLLMSRPVGGDAHDVIWRELVTKARHDGPQWMVATVGMALPRLRSIARQLTRDLIAVDPEDIDTEVLAGFIAAVATTDLDRPNVRPRLCDAAKTAGLRARRSAESHSGRHVPLCESAAPPAPSSHPDFVLADAVAKGVISELDAELIGRTRLEVRPIHEAAAELGLTVEAATKRRQRAEPLLCAAIQAGEVSADMSATITSLPPLWVRDPSTSARSRTTSDTRSDPIESKGGMGSFSGSARITHEPASVPEMPTRTPPMRPSATCSRWRRLWVAAAIAALVTLLTIVIAVAAVAAPVGPPGLKVQAVPSDLNTVFANLRNWLIGLLVTLATLMLTIGGLRYLLAGGDPGEIQKAKSAFKSAGIGYALAVLAPLFVSILKRVVGG